MGLLYFSRMVYNMVFKILISDRLRTVLIMSFRHFVTLIKVTFNCYVCTLITFCSCCLQTALIVLQWKKVVIQG